MLGSPLARAEEAPGKGMHWGAEARHQTLPRGFRTNVGTVGTLEDIMFGPSHNADGTTNYIGALRRAWQPPAMSISRASSVARSRSLRPAERALR